MGSLKAIRTIVFALAIAGAQSSCMTAYKKSVGANTDQVATKSYRTDFNEAWQATLDALKSVRLDVSNRDAGFIQTRWMDNTAQKNFADGDGMILPYMKAKYRFKVNVAQTSLAGKPVIKITVQKEQLVQKDALEDFRRQESDLIEERTLLYRIGRIVSVKMRLARAEKRRIEQEMKSFDPSSLGEDPAMTDPTMTDPSMTDPSMSEPSFDPPAADPEMSEDAFLNSDPEMSDEAIPSAEQN